MNSIWLIFVVVAILLLLIAHKLGWISLEEKKTINELIDERKKEAIQKKIHWIIKDLFERSSIMNSHDNSMAMEDFQITKVDRYNRNEGDRVIEDLVVYCSDYNFRIRHCHEPEIDDPRQSIGLLELFWEQRVVFSIKTKSVRVETESPFLDFKVLKLLDIDSYVPGSWEQKVISVHAEFDSVLAKMKEKGTHRLSKESETDKLKRKFGL